MNNGVIDSVAGCILLRFLNYRMIIKIYFGNSN